MNKTIISLIGLTVLLCTLVIALGNNIPEIEVQITDTNQILSITVIDNDVHASYERAVNPDMVISMTSETFAQIFNSDDIEGEMYLQYTEGNIQIEVLTDYTTLALKGYKSLYDSFVKEKLADSEE
ncbi:MAG: hypothetical protein ABII01_03270 [Candidatus Woesearchaeota archaeon]